MVIPTGRYWDPFKVGVLVVGVYGGDCWFDIVKGPIQVMVEWLDIGLTVIWEGLPRHGTN